MGGMRTHVYIYIYIYFVPALFVCIVSYFIFLGYVTQCTTNGLKRRSK